MSKSALISPFEVKNQLPSTQTPTQMLKIRFSMFITQENGLKMVSFKIIFEALQSELFDFRWFEIRGSFLGSKILKSRN